MADYDAKSGGAKWIWIAGVVVVLLIVGWLAGLFGGAPAPVAPPATPPAAAMDHEQDRRIGLRVRRQVDVVALRGVRAVGDVALDRDMRRQPDLRAYFARRAEDEKRERERRVLRDASVASEEIDDAQFIAGMEGGTD